MLEIRYRPRAVADLDGILTYIALELGSPVAAEKTAATILSAIEQAAEFPEMGRAFFDEDLSRPYRRILAKNHWVYYSYTSDVLTVWRIYHVTRDTDHYGFEVFEA